MQFSIIFYKLQEKKESFLRKKFAIVANGEGNRKE